MALVWKAVAAGAGLMAGRAGQKAATAAWRKTRHTDPPSDPLDPGTSWIEAIGWSALVGVALGVSRMAARRGAAVGYRKLTGHYPKGLSPAEVEPGKI